jgi:hypothetical protein
MLDIYQRPSEMLVVLYQSNCEDGCSVFLRNVGNALQDYTTCIPEGSHAVSHRRRASDLTNIFTVLWLRNWSLSIEDD